MGRVGTRSACPGLGRAVNVNLVVSTISYSKSTLGCIHDHHHPTKWSFFVQSDALRRRYSSHCRVGSRTAEGVRRWLEVGKQLPKITMYLKLESYAPSGRYSPHPWTAATVLPTLRSWLEVGVQLPKLCAYLRRTVQAGSAHGKRT